MTNNVDVLYFVAHLVVATLGAMHVLRFQTRSNSALLWIIILYSFPLFGLIAYIFFGVNRLLRNEEVLSSIRGIESPATPDSISATQVVDDSLSGLNCLSANLTNIPLSRADTCDFYQSGERAYENMLGAIGSAEHSIYLCTYIFNYDVIGKRFADALIAAHQRGVAVYVLIDGVGQWYAHKLARPYLRRHGIAVKTFLPLTLFPPNIYINLRNHRKLLIIDRRHAFIGGLNISDAYYNDGPHRSYRDLHFQLKGPVAQQLAAVFASDWAFMSSNAPALPVEPVSDRIADSTTATSPTACRTIIDDPGRRVGHLPLIIFAAINNARTSVHIITPYFLPNSELIAALSAAALRGVEVNVILPQQNNYAPVHHASRHTHEQLLVRGVNIFYQPAPFAHSKLFLIDKNYVLIGSANFEPRSFRLNYEIGVEIFSRKFGEDMYGYIQALLRECFPETKERLDQRSLLLRIIDGIAWLFTPLL